MTLILIQVDKTDNSNIVKLVAIKNVSIITNMITMEVKDNTINKDLNKQKTIIKKEMIDRIITTVKKNKEMIIVKTIIKVNIGKVEIKGEIIEQIIIREEATEKEIITNIGTQRIVILTNI